MNQKDIVIVPTLRGTVLNFGNDLNSTRLPANAYSMFYVSAGCGVSSFVNRIKCSSMKVFVHSHKSDVHFKNVLKVRVHHLSMQLHLLGYVDCSPFLSLPSF